MNPRTFSPPPGRLGRGGVSVILGLLVLGAGLALTFGLGRSARQAQQRADQARLARHAFRVQHALTALLRGYEDILRSTQGLAALHPHLDPEVWQRFTDGLDLGGRHPGLKTLALIERVAPERRAPWKQANLSIAIHGSTQLHPADRLEERPDALVIIRAHPLSAGSRAVGTDIGTSHLQRSAAELALRTGQPTLTGPLIFTVQGKPLASLGYLLPVPSLDVPVETQRWVSLGIYLDSLFASVLQGGDEGIETVVLDLDANQTLFPNVPGPELGQGPGHGIPHVDRIRVGQRTWELRSRPREGFHATAGRSVPGLILVTGSLLSLSLALMTWSLVSTRQRSVLRAQALTRSAREALKRYQALVDQVPVGVVEWTPQLKIRAVNPAGGQILGIESGATLGKSGRSALGGTRNELLQALLVEVMEGENSVQKVIPLTLADGSQRICEWTCFPLIEAEGNITGIIALVQDITARHREEEARLHQLRLESLAVLAGGISHDFNNLFGIIQGHAELAVREGDPSLARHVEPILATTRRAAALARQMLAFTGRGLHAPESIDLREFLTIAVDRIRTDLPHRIVLDLDISPDLPPVLADRGQLYQVLSILVENAQEAISGQGRIHLAAGLPSQVPTDFQRVPGLEGPGQAGVEITLSDTGEGMDASTLSRIFDPFFSTKFAGRGLGLSAVLGILKTHGAGLSLKSHPGKGSTFRMILPAHTPALNEIQIPALTPRIPARTVLFVDDEPLLRDLVQEALQFEGYKVILANDGQEALEKFEAHQQDLGVVVMDITMPRMNGIEAFRRMHAQDPRIPVILSSGYSEPAFPEEESERPTAFLSKPYPLGRLIELLGKVMGS